MDARNSGEISALAALAGGLNHAALKLNCPGARLLLLRETVSGVLRLTTSFGIEDQLLTACAAEMADDIEIVTLDTGRLFPETHAVWHETERRFARSIAAFVPAPEPLAALVARDGIDGFYDSVEKRHACCDLRKTEPLGRALQGAAAWITGLRAEQSSNRAGVAFASVDAARGLLKINPLFDFTRNAVLAELRARDVPISALEARFYRSVGCEPCTRAVRPTEPERAGRWWWEGQDAAKECGLHVAAVADAAA